MTIINYWDEVGEALESASMTLPKGYLIRLDIEKQGYSAKLILPNDFAVAADKAMSLVDEIAALVGFAIKYSDVN